MKHFGKLSIVIGQLSQISYIIVVVLMIDPLIAKVASTNICPFAPSCSKS